MKHEMKASSTMARVALGSLAVATVAPIIAAKDATDEDGPGMVAGAAGTTAVVAGGAALLSGAGAVILAAAGK